MTEKTLKPDWFRVEFGLRDSRKLAHLKLNAIREAGILTLLHPESEKHPTQAYRINHNNSYGKP